MVSCHKRVCLFMCLHFEISSVLLLRMLLPLNNAISSFSFRQRLYLSDERLKREHFLRILHFIWGTEFLRFIFRNSFESSVSFLYASKLKDLLWLLYPFLKCGFCYTKQDKNKTKKQKKKHNMVRSTIQQKCGNKRWSLLFKIIR